MTSNSIYIDGKWRTSGETRIVEDLAEGGGFREVFLADESRVENALVAADGVQNELQGATVVQRAEWMEEIAHGLQKRREWLVEVIVREAGKPISSARSEVDSAIERFRRAAGEVRSISGGFREGSTQGHEGWEAIVKHEPVGPVLAISPYNYPLSTTALQVAPALGAGNPVILKPASQTPISSVVLAEVIDSVEGIPDGAFNLVVGRGSEIGGVLSSDERVELITMTGSSDAGERVAQESGVTKLQMELGGNAPALVFSDSDVSEAASECVAGSLKYSGQRCSAVSRVLVESEVYDEVVREMHKEVREWGSGDLFDESTLIAPLIDEGQAEWVESLVEDAVSKGADVVSGGGRDGRWFEPTLLANVPRDADILWEEQFGPVVVVSSVESEDEMLSVANDGDLALDASVFTSDYDRAMRVADRVDAGAVRVNGAPSHGIGDIPFGGNESSGMGRQGLYLTIEEMMQTKSIIL